ncbi:hypothetical protein CAC42_7481 [Sphaceloma murrayae]|uniref:Uncharacterized protein n=1 Tax=Sphaceloma murrayae TaxID=2082308 RepID=A0A2K1QX59_9PEZI|nr:hypothetical protein CAC42_7481 [Sphaceloma murrayae]
MSSSNGTVVPLYILADSSQQFVGSVISANPSQTAIVLNCAPGLDSSECGYYNLSVTVGPWAASTAAPNLPATGSYDMYMAMDSGSEPESDGNQGFTFGVHCDVTSRTIPAVCTTTNIGGNNDGTPTLTITNPGASENSNDYALSLVSLTLTAGAEKLSAAATATAGGASSTGTSTGTSSMASSGSKSMSTGASMTGSGASASQTGAASVYSVNIGTVGLLFMAVAFFVR